MNPAPRFVRIDGRVVDLAAAPTIPFATPVSARPHRRNPPQPLPADVALALHRIGYRPFPVAEACADEPGGAA